MASTALAKLNEPKDAPKWTDVTVTDLMFFQFKALGASLIVSLLVGIPALIIAVVIRVTMENMQH